MSLRPLRCCRQSPRWRGTTSSHILELLSSGAIFLIFDALILCSNYQWFMSIDVKFSWPMRIYKLSTTLDVFSNSLAHFHITGCWTVRVAPLLHFRFANLISSQFFKPASVRSELCVFTTCAHLQSTKRKTSSNESLLDFSHAFYLLLRGRGSCSRRRDT